MTRTIVGMVLLTASISVSASHSFNIKVVNQATHDIEVLSVGYDAKGRSKPDMAPKLAVTSFSKRIRQENLDNVHLRQG